jgi:hypothetical protein
VDAIKQAIREAHSSWSISSDGPDTESEALAKLPAADHVDEAAVP